jgi:hypothetical protein
MKKPQALLQGAFLIWLLNLSSNQEPTYLQTKVLFKKPCYMHFVALNNLMRKKVCNWFFHLLAEASSSGRCGYSGRVLPSAALTD